MSDTTNAAPTSSPESAPAPGLKSPTIESQIEALLAHAAELTEVLARDSSELSSLKARNELLETRVGLLERLLSAKENLGGRLDGVEKRLVAAGWLQG